MHNNITNVQKWNNMKQSDLKTQTTLPTVRGSSLSEELNSLRYLLSIGDRNEEGLVRSIGSINYQTNGDPRCLYDSMQHASQS
jgi:hypothetical protein